MSEVPIQSDDPSVLRLQELNREIIAHAARLRSVRQNIEQALKTAPDDKLRAAMADAVGTAIDEIVDTSLSFMGELTQIVIDDIQNSGGDLGEDLDDEDGEEGDDDIDHGITVEEATILNAPLEAYRQMLDAIVKSSQVPQERAAATDEIAKVNRAQDLLVEITLEDIDDEPPAHGEPSEGPLS